MDTTDPTAPERSASLTLDQIREGGQALVMLARARLSDCEDALAEGRFCDAFGHLQEAGGKLQALATAESALGTLAGSFIVRAEQVQAGMVVRGHGVVTEVRREEKPVPGSDPCVHLHISFEGGEPDMEIHAENEIVIMRGDDA